MNYVSFIESNCDLKLKKSTSITDLEHLDTPNKLWNYFFSANSLRPLPHSNAHEARKNQLIQAMRHVLGLHARRGSDGASDQTDADTPHSHCCRRTKDKQLFTYSLISSKWNPVKKKNRKKENDKRLSFYSEQTNVQQHTGAIEGKPQKAVVERNK